MLYSHHQFIFYKIILVAVWEMDGRGARVEKEKYVWRLMLKRYCG